MRLHKAESDCGKVVRDVVSTLTPTAMKKGVKLQPEIEDDLRTLLADSERLRQVLPNLTENAIKFTPLDGSVTVGDRGGITLVDTELCVPLLPPG